MDESSVRKSKRNHFARDRKPSGTGQAVFRGMNGIASPLRRKKRNKEVDPRLRLAGVFIFALHILARPEDVEFLLADRDVGSFPIADLVGHGAHVLNIPP